MKDRYLVTLEIETYDGDPREWDWEKLSTGEDVIKILKQLKKLLLIVNYLKIIT
jgi:hypothetical protein